VPLAPGSSVAALPPFQQFLPQQEYGTWVGPGLREQTQMAAFRVSATRPLVVLVEMDRSVGLAPWGRLVKRLLGAGAAMVLLVAGLTAVAWRSVRAREVARAERDLAQAEVAQRERELSVTIQSLQELIFRTDVHGVLNYANQPWAAKRGGGRPLWELVVPAQREAARALFARASDTDVRHLQASIGEEGSEQRSYDFSVMPLHEGGQLVGFAGSAVNVTARVQAQRRLQAQLGFNEMLMDISPLPKSVVDMQGRYVIVNKSWETFTGRRREAVIGQRVGQHLPLAERAVHEAQDRLLMQTRQPVRYEARALHHDGGLRDVVVNKLLVPGEDGQPAGVLSVLVDVTEFRAAERATLEARDAAEEASRTKSEFIANISHELRTPLQSIIGFSELGLRRGGDQPRLAGMFEDIHNAGQRMLALVNDLLDVAKIESTVGTIHLERADLRGLVRHVVKELQPLLDGKQLRVDLQLGDLPLRARVDPLRFQQVVRNVLANAIKFSPALGTVAVHGGHTDAGELELRITDQGPGIPPAELESIFQAFVQSSKTKDGSGGTGLGLAISRKIIEAHGGRIQAANRPEGGSVFTLNLPARAGTETMPAPL
jgi:PAS domain S-box-containing protein